MQAFLKGLTQVDEGDFGYSTPNSFVLNQHNRLTHLAINERSDIDWSVIRNSPALVWLGFESNNLASLPESIGQLQNLQILDLDSNNLTSLPESIRKLQNMK